MVTAQQARLAANASMLIKLSKLTLFEQIMGDIQDKSELGETYIYFEYD